MIIKVLGSGCSKCSKLYDLVNEVISNEGIEAEVSKVEDMKEIIGYGVMKTPALVVDEKVMVSGAVPNKKQILKYLKG